MYAILNILILLHKVSFCGHSWNWFRNCSINYSQFFQKKSVVLQGLFLQTPPYILHYRLSHCSTLPYFALVLQFFKLMKSLRNVYIFIFLDCVICLCIDSISGIIIYLLIWSLYLGNSMFLTCYRNCIISF